MLQNEARELLVEGYKKIHEARTIAEIFSVSVPTVYRLAEQKDLIGSCQRGALCGKNGLPMEKFAQRLS